MPFEKLHLLASPWWVNLVLLAPVLSYLYLRRTKLSLTWQTLGILAVFAGSFGFVEAVVVVYLQGALANLAQNSGFVPSQSSAASYQQALSFVAQIPRNLRIIEVCREVATMLMLVSVALLAARESNDRWAAFLWTFAGWDIAYYAGLWATLRWPASLYDYDMLFLIPVPWVSQVWFPLLVSAISMLVVALSRKRSFLES